MGMPTEQPPATIAETKTEGRRKHNHSTDSIVYRNVISQLANEILSPGICKLSEMMVTKTRN